MDHYGNTHRITLSIMTQLQSNARPQSDDFKRNHAQMSALVDDLQTHVAAIAAGGSADARARHEQQGKLLPRARIQTLLDPGSPFLELSQFAAFNV